MPNDPDLLVGNMSKAARWLLPFFSAPILVALDAYLGMQRMQAQLEYFSMSVSLVNPSIPDYIERGVGITARSLFIVALLGLALFTAHSRVRKASPTVRRDIGTSCAIAGVPALALGVAGWFNWFVYSGMYPVVPMLTAMGTNLCVYGLYLRRRARVPASTTDRAIAATLILINSYLALWIMGIYAQLTGIALAEDLDRNPPITVCAAKPLGIPETPAEHPDRSCRHRYPDLRHVACGDTRCVFARKGDDGAHVAYLIQIGEGIVFTGGSDTPTGVAAPA